MSIITKVVSLNWITSDEPQPIECCRSKQFLPVHAFSMLLFKNHLMQLTISTLKTTISLSFFITLLKHIIHLLQIHLQWQSTHNHFLFCTKFAYGQVIHLIDDIWYFILVSLSMGFRICSKSITNHNIKTTQMSKN